MGKSYNVGEGYIILKYLEDECNRITKERRDVERELVKMRKEVSDKLNLEVELINMMNEIRLKIQGCEL